MWNERFWRDASGRLTYETSSVSAADYPAACRAVADAFALAPDGSLVVGPDQMFWDFRRANQAVSLDWDVWMGFLIVARTDGSESLVRDIAAWLGLTRCAWMDRPA